MRVSVPYRVYTAWLRSYMRCNVSYMKPRCSNIACPCLVKESSAIYHIGWSVFRKQDQIPMYLSVTESAQLTYSRDIIAELHPLRPNS
jgi:hypothetical protein